MIRGFTHRALVSERSYCAIRPGPPFGSTLSREAPSECEDTRLSTGASVLLILLSSLGLWAMIWAIVTALA